MTITSEERDAPTVDAIRQCIHDVYRIDGVMSRLPGENLNYLVEAKDDRKYVAKIAGDELPPILVSLQHQAIKHATGKGTEASGVLEFPIILENRRREPETRIELPLYGRKRLRLLSFIEGVNLSDLSDISKELAFELGFKLGSYSRMMADFVHPAADRHHRWNLAHADQHIHKVGWVENAEQRGLLAWAFAQWTGNASMELAQLDWQFIHGDFNPENIRVRNGRIVGLLDFDDACWNPAICELAICLAYQMMDHEDPWPVAAAVIDGYRTQRPITPAEEAVLLPLVQGRLAVSISVATERRRIDPTNANWFVSEKPAWKLLAQIEASGHRQFPSAVHGM